MRILQRRNETNINKIKNYQGHSTHLSDIDKLQQTLFNNLWSFNQEILDIGNGKHDDVFDEEDKKEIIQMIEQDNFEMRKQRILSGIRKDKKNNYKVLKEIFGVEGITIQ
tara:strand:- start:2390 stop:2719 length:330 start_codon:yes stop_codon:yes gene_type:complete